MAVRRALREGFSYHRGHILTKKNLLRQGVNMERDVAFSPSRIPERKPRPGEQARAPRLNVLRGT